jgi:hypothetical protein
MLDLLSSRISQSVSIDMCVYVCVCVCVFHPDASLSGGLSSRGSSSCSSLIQQFVQVLNFLPADLVL